MARKNKMTKHPKPSKRSKLRLYALSGVVVVVALFAAWLFTSNSQSQAQQKSLSLNPPLSLASGIQGQAANLDLSQYAGQVVVVNFMAGWCASCWAEIPDFVEVYEDHKTQGLVMLGISLQTPPEQTLSMIEQMGISYPVFQDEDGKVALERFGLRAMPTTFVYNRKGELAKRLDGEVSGQMLLAAINDLL